MSTTELSPPITILAIDDDARNCRLLNALLRADGFEPLFAHSGEEGLAIAKTERPHLILLDLMMPGMDGFQVIKELKENPDTHDIPLLVSSALDDQASLERVLASGAQDFICKPIDRWELSLRLHRLLSTSAKA